MEVPTFKVKKEFLGPGVTFRKYLQTILFSCPPTTKNKSVWVQEQDHIYISRGFLDINFRYELRILLKL